MKESKQSTQLPQINTKVFVFNNKRYFFSSLAFGILSTIFFIILPALLILFIYSNDVSGDYFVWGPSGLFPHAIILPVRISLIMLLWLFIEIPIASYITTLILRKFNLSKRLIKNDFFVTFLIFLALSLVVFAMPRFFFFIFYS